MYRVNELEEVLDLSFQNKELLKLALVHTSYLNENSELVLESNERLEFLGDALIGLIIASELYRRHPGLQEGYLTRWRSELVKTETLADVAQSLSLGRYLLLGRGEQSNGGRSRESNLAAAFEALLGSLFLDSGFDAVNEFVLKVMSERLSFVDQNISINNPKSTLQEFSQEMGSGVPVYKVVSSKGESHSPIFEVEVLVADKLVGRGIGHRKSIAEQNAANEALTNLKANNRKIN